MNFKFFCALFISCVLLPVGVFLALAIGHDPLQVFSKHDHRPFHSNMRLQNIGIIRHYAKQFDSIIFGSSVFENSSAAQASTLFHERFANLSVTASDFYERHIMLSYFLQRKSLKTVIYSVDSVYRYQQKGYELYPLTTWTYLYNESTLDDLQVYLSKHQLKCLVLMPSSPDCMGKATSLDRPNEWMTQPNQVMRFGGIEHWLSAQTDKQVRYDLQRIIEHAEAIQSSHLATTDIVPSEPAKKYVAEYVLSLVRAYPDTQFKFVFPPYSRVQFAMWYQFDTYSANIHRDIVRYLTLESEKYPNMSVYGFEDRVFLDDLGNYKDLIHYHPDINSQIQHDVAADSGRLTAQNVDAYLETAKQKGLAYDLLGLADKIKPHLK